MTARDFSYFSGEFFIEGLRTDGIKDFIHIGTKEIEIDKKYSPTLDAPDDYMNIKQLAFFKKVLLLWKEDLCSKTKITISNLSEDSNDRRVSEEGDFAAEEERVLTELRTRDRYRKLIHKIEEALIRIETGEYGYCEETGEEIGIQRLMVRPIAIFCISAQNKHETEEKNDNDFKKGHESIMSDINSADEVIL